MSDWFKSGTVASHFAKKHNEGMSGKTELC